MSRSDSSTELGAETGAPPYLVIAAELRRRILRGDVKVGEAIPSEQQLARTYGVSRMTARQAVSVLVNQGLLDRQQGRGTFVHSNQIVRGLSSVSGFREDLERDGLKPGSRTVSIDRRRPTSIEAKRLEIGRLEPVWDLVRVRSADGVTMALQLVVIPVSVLPDLDQLDLNTGSLYRTLSSRGWPLTTARQRIRAVVDPGVAAVLEVSDKTAFLKVSRVSSGPGPRPVEWLVSYFVGDVYAYDVELH